jgi:hypothetical protein
MAVSAYTKRRDVNRQGKFAKISPVDSALNCFFRSDPCSGAKKFQPPDRTFHPSSTLLLEGLMRLADTRQNARFKNN